MSKPHSQRRSTDRAFVRSRLLTQLHRAPCSRAALCALLGMSSNTVYPYIKALLVEGLVEDLGPVRSGTGGPPANLYRALGEPPAPEPVPEIRTTIRGPWPGLNYTGGKS